MKMAQGLSLNTVVIAAIVLVVLIIALGIIFGTTNKTAPFFDKQAECEARGGNCIGGSETCSGTKVYGLSDCKEKACCIKEYG